MICCFLSCFSVCRVNCIAQLWSLSRINVASAGFWACQVSFLQQSVFESSRQALLTLNYNPRQRHVQKYILKTSKLIIFVVSAGKSAGKAMPGWAAGSHPADWKCDTDGPRISDSPPLLLWIVPISARKTFFSLQIYLSLLFFASHI